MSSVKQALDQAVAALNAKDEASFVAMFAPDVDLPAPGGLSFKGIDGVKQWYRLWTIAFPNCHVQYPNVVTEGDQLMGEGKFTGTHTGVLHLPTGDVPPTGKTVKVDFSAVVRTTNGKVSYLRHYLDTMELMGQLGLIGAGAAAG